MAARIKHPSWRQMRQPPPTQRTGGVIHWLRATGLVSELFGFGGLVFGNHFFIATAVVYFGLIVLLLDLFYEPTLSKRWKGAICLVLIAVIVFFSAEVTFKQAPLDVSASGPENSYPDGETVGGIIWRSSFTGISVSITNRSNVDYDDYTVAVVSDQPMVTISPKTALPGCVVQPVNQSYPTLTAAKEAPHNPIALLATTAGFLVRCSKLPARFTMNLEAAVASVDESQELLKKRMQLLPETDAVLPMDLGHLGKSWWGHPEGDIYRKGPAPTYVIVHSEYQATFKPHVKEYTLPLTSPSLFN